MELPERMAGKRMEALSLAMAFAEGFLDMATGGVCLRVCA